MAEPLVINSATPIGSGRFYYKLDTNQGEYYYTPFEFANKGLLQGETQFFDQGFLRNPDILKQATPIRIESGLTPNLERAGYENANNGLLLTRDQAKYLLGQGKETFSDWDNVTNAGWIDQYNINQLNTNTGAPFGAITKLGEFKGTPVYIRPTESGQNYSYILPSEQFDTGFSLRNTNITVEKKGGVLGDIARGIGNLFGSIPIVGDIAAFALGGPVLLGISKGGQVASAGGSPMDAFKSGAISGAIAGGLQGYQSAGGFASAPSGIEGFAQAADEVGGAAGGYTPTPAPTGDYGLLGGANFPTQAAGMGGGTGLIPGTAGQGLQVSTSPNVAGMGGAQGLTVPVAGGIVSQLGLTPTGAVPVLGDPGSFINNPDVLGQPVIQQGTPAASLSIADALRGARLVNSLLNQPQQPTQTQPIGSSQGMGATGIDYSGLLSLLASQPRVSGLLGTQFQPQSINLASLLG